MLGLLLPYSPLQGFTLELSLKHDQLMVKEDLAKRLQVPPANIRLTLSDWYGEPVNVPMDEDPEISLRKMLRVCTSRGLVIYF